MFRSLFIFGIILSAVSCTAPVHVKTERYHNLPKKATRSNYVIDAPWSGNTLQAVEFGHLIEQKFIKYGWNRVTTKEAANYYVLIQYGHTGTQVIRGSQPVYGVTSFGGSSSYSGNVGSTTFGGSSYTAPTIGAIGTVATQKTFHDYILNMAIFDLKTKKLVAQATSTAATERTSLAEAIPALINGMFHNFPGKSGKVRFAPTY